ncbi:MAG TPA: acid phosphatase [Rhizomicrobium sp.]|jgi:phospholipase C|nr:acid phosphatase [Rhizomicrobium sp.]
MRRNALLLTAAFAVALFGTDARSASPLGLSRIQHIVVIYEENRSFDNFYGRFPGANGVARAGKAAKQVDLNGRPFVHLPPVCLSAPPYPAPDPATGAQVCNKLDPDFPPDLPNAPFDAGKYVPLDGKSNGDLVHKFYQEQDQIDGGRMDRFAAVSNAAALVMGTFDGSKLKMWKLAREFVLADNFFHAAFGGSFLNHQWLACACTPRFENAPREIVAVVGSDGQLVKDGEVTPDGYAVNTLMPPAPPQPVKEPLKSFPRLPPQTAPTIGDRLSDAGISWAWYSEGFDHALAGIDTRQFQYHHQPYIYFARFAEGTRERAEHLKDGRDFESAIAHGTLPAVSFYKPVGDLNQHPNYATILDGDRKSAQLIESIRANKILWRSTVIVVTYDENGGAWDHVAPPKIDRWGPGTRVPAIVISPFAKRHFVDHTRYDTTSILKLIEVRFGLKPLGSRDGSANDMTNALNLRW